MPPTLNLDHRRRRDLGVHWMNRGHELQLRGDPASLAGAIAAYAEAIVFLSALPVRDAAGLVVSLGAALMNHGQLLHRAHGLDRADDAMASLDRAIALLREAPAEGSPWSRRNLAGSLLNRANLLIDLTRLTDATLAATQALALSLPHERTELVDADLALKSRRALCDILGQLLVAPGANQPQLATEASELVDDSLGLIREWTRRGKNIFQPLTHRLFHFGAQLYRINQPHFLAEFIEENLPLADEIFRVIALKQIDAALDPRHAPRYLMIGDPASERFIETVSDLSATRERLADLPLST